MVAGFGEGPILTNQMKPNHQQRGETHGTTNRLTVQAATHGRPDHGQEWADPVRRIMGLETLLDQHLPQPRSGRGLKASHYVMPLSLTLYGGGETIEDVRELRDGHPLRTAIDLKLVPSSAAIGDWLKRMGRTGGLQLTYHLFLAQRLLTMPEVWASKTIKSMRWLLVEVGGTLITHGRQLILTLAASVEKYRLYLEMRRRTYDLLRA